MWRADFREAAGTFLMTAEAPTADLAFTRLRERTVAAGQRWEVHGADEPWRRSIVAFRQ